MRDKNKFNFDVVQNKYILKGSSANNTLPKTAIGYMRVSTEDQAEHGDGIASQKAAIMRYAKNHGITVIEWFKDEAISGTIDNRPGINQAIEFLTQQNKHQIVISYFISTELSRISRNTDLLKTMELESRIKKTNTKIVTIDYAPDVKKNSSIDLSDDMKRLLAKHEAKVGSERTLNGLKNVIYQGKRPFAMPPLGYKKNQDTGILEKDEPIAGYIKQGLEHYLSGELKTKKDLYLFLEDKRIKSNSHSYKGKLHPSIVDTLLDDFRLLFYCGELVYPPREVYEPIKGIHEPLLEKSFVNKLISYNRHKKIAYIKQEKKTKVIPELFLKGIVYCKVCGSKLTGGFCKGKKGERYPYYRCLNKACPERKLSYIIAHKLEANVISYLKESKATPKMLQLLERVFDDARQNMTAMKSEMANRKKDEIGIIKNEMSKLENKIISLSNNELILKLEEKRHDLNSRKTQLEKIIEEETVKPEHFDRILKRSQVLFTAPELIDQEPNAELKQLLIGVQTESKIWCQNHGCIVGTPENSVLNLTKKIAKCDFDSVLVNGAEKADLFLNLETLYKTLGQLQYKLEYIQSHFDVSRYLNLY